MNRSDDGTRINDADAGNGLEPLAVGILAMLREKPLVDSGDLGLAQAICATSAVRLARAFSGKRASLASATIASRTLRPS
jgi:hypothetical protein